MTELGRRRTSWRSLRPCRSRRSRPIRASTPTSATATSSGRSEHWPVGRLPVHLSAVPPLPFFTAFLHCLSLPFFTAFLLSLHGHFVKRFEHCSFHGVSDVPSLPFHCPFTASLPSHHYSFTALSRPFCRPFHCPSLHCRPSTALPPPLSHGLPPQEPIMDLDHELTLCRAELASITPANVAAVASRLN